ncbi:16S rRNA (cytosine(1402)-N(4))-methyltransferase [bacterium F11]|nr:16S rRNA (cytosine(1402)-N(4))-methyltransferase [bacterium F11]
MHEPVLLKEVLQYLEIKQNGRYVDGTLGLGGHAEAILRQLGPKGEVLGLDVDAETLAQAEDRLQPFEDQTITRRVNFRGLQGVLQELGWTGVDGMLFDLGVSSVQLNDPKRGISFQSEGPLDMRLDTEAPHNALTLLKQMKEDELAEVFYEFGVRRNPRRISRYLLHDVREGKITTTTDLAGFCDRVVGRRGRIHPATKIFLALRSLVNNEQQVLKDLLQVAPLFLNQGGRLAIISFHSVEDRIVKNEFRSWSQDGKETSFCFARATRKPIQPSAEEVQANPRSRSAKLRVLERIQ